MSVDIFIQSRYNSTRLPGKALKTICGKPILQWVIEAAKLVSNARKVILCTSKNRDDDRLQELGEKLAIEVIRGSENDVLARFIQAGEFAKSDHVVRICADNPLINTLEIERLIEQHLANKNIYTFNHIPKLNNKYPDGFGAEAISFKKLKEFDMLLPASDAHREHVTSLIWTEPFIGNVSTLQAPENIAFPNIKLDIDTEEDFIKIEALTKEIHRRGLSPKNAREVCSVYLEIFGEK